MRKYEEEHYRLDKIKDNIYPWVKGELIDYKVIMVKRFPRRIRLSLHLREICILFWLSTEEMIHMR